ncbi:S-adenosyl-L-methionine-dependent methyltransferase [Irpex rosettiformis]|uniref:S-adenosyl-L-methionine-dependent methyltransferase n=1 Tax=Irpex rosettiformis TaxID=378272 RepID=A0ACB8TUY2_9APHY|nr:S-adenosyl-L-methionine-dependent methyltransferase [Irpex rosettiformis]
MSEELQALCRILNEAVDTILTVCDQRNEDFPSINAPVQPSEFSAQGIRNDASVARAIKLGVAAANQLAITLQSPLQTVIGFGPQATLSANVAAVERNHVAEIIRRYGSEGMRASDIVKYNGTTTSFPERILRHLATHHVFREVSPGVFAHNMLSSLLDSGKDLEVIIKKYFDDTNGLLAFMSVLTHEQMKTYAYIPELMTDIAIVDSQELNDASVQKAYNTKLGYWKYLDLPENAFVNRRFNIAMQGISSMQPPGTILTTYDWKSLPEYGLVVDIGSGLGHVSLDIASVRPDLNFVLEDREVVLQDAKEHWAKYAPAILANTHFIPTDYLSPQPPLPATPDIFVLRHILHNLSDKYASILLKHLRTASGPHTKLVVIDYVVEHPCLTPQNSNCKPQDAIPGATAPTAPSPLLPNFGVAAALPYHMDMIMLSHFNSKERTIENWTSLLSASGWELVRVNRDATNKTDWPLLVAEIA